MRNIFKKSFLFIVTCLLASNLWAEDVTFTMSSIFDGNNLSISVTNPVAATVSTNASKSNSKTGKLGSDGNYFQIILDSRTFTAVTINGFINTGTIEGKNWAFQFSTDKGANWSSEVTQPNDGNKNAHDIIVSVTIPANANGFRVIRRAGTSTQVNSITMSLASSGPVAVSGVSLNKTATSIEAGQSEQLTATVSPAGADDPSVTWSSNNTAVATVDQNGNVSALAPGTATITVTTTDGNKTATCTVTVTAPPAPIDVQSISMKSATTIGIGASETLTVTYNPADANTNKALTWNSNNTSVATVDANGKVTGISAGTATITATTANGKTATCSVTVQAVAVTGVTLNKASLSLQIGGSETLTATIAPTDATNKNISWISSNPAVATVDSNGKVVAKTAGNTTITVTTTDGNKTATCNVTVTAGPPVPDTDLTIHVPEIYEEKELAGGYNTPLVNYNQREYEVFYLGKSKPAGASGDIAVTYTLNHKGGYLVSSPSGSGTSMTAKDGWFKATISSLEGSFKEASEIEAKASARDEFADLPGDLKMKNNNTFELHIQGYDQFSIVAQDKKKDTKGTTPADNRYWEVYIDGSLQPQYFDKDNATTRRYDITTGRHVISLKAIGSEDSKLYGFSLRVAQEPRTKWLKGNDSTQVVMQTAAIKPVTYVTKYNNIQGAETKLEWIGNQANGINLTTIPGTLTDTLVLKGQANCAVGTYNYAVVAYYNNVETSRATGKFIVASDIQATSETNVEVYQNEEMDQITFNYFALSANDVQLTWPNGQPTGISGSGNNGKYIIGGTPTTIGTYPFTITVAGADTIISGQIKVNELNYGNNPILYLYKNNLAYEKDGIHNYLKGKGKNLIERKAKEDGLRPENQYKNYKLIIISEDADADNAEVLAVIRGGANLPILNLKGFTYTSDRLNWGEPDNGAVDSMATKDKGCNIWIEQASHPIFRQLTNRNRGDKVKILSSYERNGVMPIAITNAPGTLCLATGMTRSIEDYYAEGEQQTAIHEVPASMRGGQKYICLPVASQVNLSTEGKKLIDGVVDYLLSQDDPGINTPTLGITAFSVAGMNANINQGNNTISLRMTEQQYTDLDSLKSVEPSITLADPNTHVSPAGKVSLQYMYVIPQTFVVTDYISRRVYEFMLDLYDPHEGIDNIYEAGQWINIFDIYGRKVATTNEDFRTMDLPRGMYIIVTESGKTLKIMK
ncbi:MAG: Ig domain-containing protein [Paludibacteraceae bacterium]|nr:Ig domain-containing protein [Paludibacteraceae bacterium]